MVDDLDFLVPEHRKLTVEEVCFVEAAMKYGNEHQKAIAKYVMETGRMTRNQGLSMRTKYSRYVPHLCLNTDFYDYDAEFAGYEELENSPW